ncbi:unnamed protein product [Chrysoparadoxa australica]
MKQGMMDTVAELQNRMIVDLVKDMQAHVDKVLDVRAVVVQQLVADKSMLVDLFKQCGRAEFAFLVNSGFWVGFLLGVAQMGLWLVYSKPWTLPVGGAVVGYLTNWLALKLIFEPINPIKLGPFTLQGLFLKRQGEVSVDFALFFATNCLTSARLWQGLLFGTKAPAFYAMLKTHVSRFLQLASGAVGAPLDATLVTGLASKVAEKLPEHVHVLHDYIDNTLALEGVLSREMLKLPSTEFVGILRSAYRRTN